MEKVKTNVELDELINAMETLFNALRDKHFDFCLTGTCALMAHGLLPDGYVPQDIDVLVYAPTENQLDWLKEQMSLSGKEKENYSDRVCYTFVVREIKVNVLIPCQKKEGCGDCDRFNNLHAELFGQSVFIQPAYRALQAKLRLARPKDYQFFNQLVSEIWSSSLKK